MVIAGIPLTICLILVVGLFLLGSDISKQAEKIKQLRETLSAHLQATDSLALLRQDFQQVQPYLPAIQNALPTQDQLVVFSRDLSAIARQNQIDLNSSLGQETSRTSNGLGQLSFTMIGQGSFDNLINFLKAVKSSHYFIKFTGVDFTRQNNVFKASLNGEIFLL